MANNKASKRASGSQKSDLTNPPPPPPPPPPQNSDLTTSPTPAPPPPAPSQKSDLPTSPTPAPPPPPPPLVFKCIPTRELKVDTGDGLALVKYTPQQVLHAVEEGARMYLAGTKVRGLKPGKAEYPHYFANIRRRKLGRRVDWAPPIHFPNQGTSTKPLYAFPIMRCPRGKLFDHRAEPWNNPDRIVFSVEKERCLPRAGTMT